MSRDLRIDYLKTCAIVMIITQHSLSNSIIQKIGGAFYISQAVSIFIILSAYNFANSYNRINVITIIDCYRTNTLKKISRILVPFIIMFLIELLILLTINTNISLYELLIAFITGGYGPGSYFTPIMIQLILIFPLLYYWGKKNMKSMLIVIFLINLCFEVYAHFNLTNNEYRLILIRYLFLISLGIYLSLVKTANKYIIIICTAISIMYIFSIHYLNFKPPVFLQWQSRNVPSFFYPFALILLSFKYLPQKINATLKRIIVLISNSTFHIFLIQMMYFWLSINSKLPIPSIVKPLFNILICTIIGVLFYKSEKTIKFKKNNNRAVSS